MVEYFLCGVLGGIFSKSGSESVKEPNQVPKPRVRRGVWPPFRGDSLASGRVPLSRSQSASEPRGRSPTQRPCLCGLSGGGQDIHCIWRVEASK